MTVTGSSSGHLDADGSRDVLAMWLLDRLEGATSVVIEDITAPRSGYSAETIVLSARVTSEGTGERVERFVLRQETPDPPVYPEQTEHTDTAILLQYQAMEAVAAASTVPIAPLLGYESDADLIGAPFFVMGHVDGDVPVENPIYTREGFFVEASPADRRTMVLDGLRILASIHRVDWQQAGMKWLVPDGATPGTGRSIDIWEDYARQALAGRKHPLIDQAFAWIRANQPVDPPLSLSWGDARPGNIIWRDFRCACVTDWEAVGVAPAEHDLGWWLMFDRWSHETMGVERLPGEPTRAEQAAYYERCLGRDVEDIHFYEVFAAARYAGILVRVMNRRVDRGELSPDHTIWLENPVASCLADILGSS